MALTAPQFSWPVNWAIIQYRSRTKLEDVMFFKRQQAQFPNWGSLREIAWDDKTVEWIAQSDRLDVRLTHIQKTVSFGQSIYGSKDSSECSVHGVMTFPKFIPVSITFADDERFGAFFYDRRDNHNFNGRKINLPSLGIWLSDRDGKKAELLYATLRDAIMRGSKYLGVRFWKNKGEGLMTQTEKERGYSSQYAILGMVTWLELHAQKLPKWAIPTDYRDFSLNALPMNLSDVDRQLN